MPKKFDELGIVRFDNAKVGSKNKYATKESFAEALLELDIDDFDFGNNELILKEILEDIQTTYVRGCICSYWNSTNGRQFHYEIADKAYDINSKQLGVFECWQYGDI